MKLAALSFLHACLWATGVFSTDAPGKTGEPKPPHGASSSLSGLVAAALSGEGSSPATLTVSPGDVVLLPCSSAGVVAPRSTTWAKNGRELLGGGGGGGGGAGLRLLPDGTLSIAEVTPGDEGSYLCNSTLQDNSTFLARVRLRVTSEVHQD